MLSLSKAWEGGGLKCSVRALVKRVELSAAMKPIQDSSQSVVFHHVTASPIRQPSTASLTFFHPLLAKRTLSQDAKAFASQ